MFQLIEVLKTIKDFRKPSGRRHPLWFILLITILGLMTGHLGYRAIGDFAKAHRELLTQYFGIPRGEVPSYSTIRLLRQMADGRWQMADGRYNECDVTSNFFLQTYHEL